MALSRLTIETGEAARIEVRDTANSMFQPLGSVVDNTVSDQIGIPPTYRGHFVSTGTCTLQLPHGVYTVIVERGTEYRRLETTLEIRRDVTITMRPERWINMAALGWRSADFHIHRPIEDAALILKSEDLNMGVFITMWNANTIWPEGEFSAPATIVVDSDHIVTLSNAEDERGGGAWMLHNLKAPLPLKQHEWWYPDGVDLVNNARDSGAWFDCEKSIWWEVPVMMALSHVDSIGVLNNHYTQYGMVANEAWGRPRDQSLFPGARGFSDYQLSLYYRFLNCGFRLPASAGSASGVLPSPAGYSRVYAHVPGSFTATGFYDALRAGRSFVTNGPMLFIEADGATVGDDLHVQEAKMIGVRVKAESRGRIERVELIANGEVIESSEGPELVAQINLDGRSWLAARCYELDDSTLRLAHTSPIYLSGPSQHFDARADHSFFVAWIDELMELAAADSNRFTSEQKRDRTIATYQRARSYFSCRA
jgi:hypothetical protein